MFNKWFMYLFTLKKNYFLYAQQFSSKQYFLGQILIPLLFYQIILSFYSDENCLSIYIWKYIVKSGTSLEFKSNFDPTLIQLLILFISCGLPKDCGQWLGFILVLFMGKKFRINFRNLRCSQSYTSQFPSAINTD